MTLEHSALTNRLLRRSRTLLACADSASDRAQRQELLAAAVTALDQAVCAWIAEIVSSPPAQRSFVLAVGHFPAALSQFQQEETAELEELHRLREQPDSALAELQAARLRDLQPPLDLGSLQLISDSSQHDVAAVQRWLREIDEVVERGRQTVDEC